MINESTLPLKHEIYHDPTYLKLKYSKDQFSLFSITFFLHSNDKQCIKESECFINNGIGARNNFNDIFNCLNN